MFDHRPEDKVRKENTLMAMLIITILTVSLLLVGSASATAPITITSTPSINGYTGQLYHYTLAADQASYMGPTSVYPSWASVNHFSPANMINIDGTPTSIGDYQFNIQMVSQIGGGTVWQNWTVHVTNPTWPPHVVSTPITQAYVGVLYHYQVVLNETEGFITVYNASSWLGYSPSAMFLEGTPTSTGTDNLSIKIRPAGDTTGLIATWQNFTITVSSYSPGFTTSPPTTGSVGSPYTYTPVPTMNSSSFYMGATDLPSWLTFDSHTFNGTPLASGSYNVNLILVNYNSGWPVTIAWQNWTITIGTAIVPNFVWTPPNMFVISLNQLVYHNCSTDIPCNVTLLCGPAFLHLNGPNLSGYGNLEGHYRVIIMARSIAYNTTVYQIFDIKVNPLTFPSVPVPNAWNSVIPIFFLVIVMIISAISPEGISRNIFLASGVSGIAVLVWVGCFPNWALVVAAIIIAFMVYDTQQDQGVMQ